MSKWLDVLLIFVRCGVSIIVAFSQETLLQNSNGVTLAGGVKYTLGMKKLAIFN